MFPKTLLGTSGKIDSTPESLGFRNSYGSFDEKYDTISVVKSDTLDQCTLTPLHQLRLSPKQQAKHTMGKKKTCDKTSLSRVIIVPRALSHPSNVSAVIIVEIDDDRLLLFLHIINYQ